MIIVAESKYDADLGGWEHSEVLTALFIGAELQWRSFDGQWLIARDWMKATIGVNSWRRFRAVIYETIEEESRESYSD